MQYLYLASEMTAAGMTSGTITSIAFNVLVKNSTIPYTGFSIKIGCTSATSLSGYIPGLVTVYSSSYSTVPGWNNHNFAMTYDWDGTSNIVIETCYDNSVFSTSDVVQMDAMTASLSYFGYQDNFIGTCNGILANSGTNPNRPNIRFGYCASTAGGPPITGPYLTYAGGLVIGTPATGYRGPGTINAQSVYDDGLLLTDYVYDSYFDGKVAKEDLPHHSGFKMDSINEMINYISKYRHLPSIKGRDEWKKKGKFSLGELSQELWETVEIQSLYIKELHERLSKLENEVDQLRSGNDKVSNSTASKDFSTQISKSKDNDPYRDLIESIKSVENTANLSQDKKREIIEKLKLDYEKNQQ
jgi:hypothetical protein